MDSSNEVPDLFQVDVFKLGGHAIFNHLDKIIKIIKSDKKSKVLVISAIGEVTDLMEKLINFTKKKEIAQTIRNIKNIYISLIEDNIQKPTTKQFLLTEVDMVFGKIMEKMHKALSGRLEDSDKSYFLTRGEHLTAFILERILSEKGLSIQFIEAETIIATEDVYMDAPINYRKTNKNIRDKILPQLKKGNIVILAGLTGYNTKKLVTYLGINSGDITAAVIARGLNKRVSKVTVTFIKNTMGWQSADRKMVENPKNIEYITLEEASKALKLGYELVHSESIENLLEQKIKVKMFGTINDSETNIVESRKDAKDAPIVSIVGREIYFLVIKNNYDKGYGYSRLINEVIEKYKGSISYEGGVITSIAKTVTFEDLNGSKLDIVIRHLKEELAENAKSVSIEEKSEVHIVGTGICSKPGILISSIQILCSHGIKCFACQAEDTVISIIIPKRKKKQAITLLHDTFF